MMLLFSGTLSGCLTATEPTASPASSAAAPSFQGDVDRYWAALTQICDRGVTPEMRTRFAAARQAVEAARYGGGTGSNFWGLRDPDAVYEDCRQAPGWE